MKQVWYSLRLAFSMYSVIPAPKVEKNKENMQYILVFVPWVGIIIGFLISKWRLVYPYLFDNELLRSVICVKLSILLSGLAHMDGFFRTVDAVSSHKPRTGKLDILQDSHSGYSAIITCVCYFFLIVGLWSEMPISGWPVVCVGFVLSRAIYGLSILWMKHSRESKCSQYVPDGGKKWVVTVILILYVVGCAVMMLNMNLSVGLGCLAGALIALFVYFWVAFKHFGGITEDIASFFVQICEIMIPLMALLVYRMPTDFSAY